MSSGDTFVERVGLLLDRAADMHASDPLLAAFTAVATIELQRHPELRDLVRQDARTVYRFFERLVREAPGEISQDDSQSVINMLVAVFTGFSVFGASSRSSTAHREGIEAFKRMLAGTLLP
jgi:hypothetical protein